MRRWEKVRGLWVHSVGDLEYGRLGSFTVLQDTGRCGAIPNSLRVFDVEVEQIHPK